MKLGMSSTFQVDSLTKERCIFFVIQHQHSILKSTNQVTIPCAIKVEKKKTLFWTLFHMGMRANFSWRTGTKNQQE